MFTITFIPQPSFSKRLVDLAVINAMVVYFEQNAAMKSKYQAHKKFRVALIHALVEAYVENRESIVKGDDPATRLQGKRFPKRMNIHFEIFLYK